MSSNSVTSATFQAGSVIAACYLEIDRRNADYKTKQDTLIQEWLDHDKERRKNWLYRLFHRKPLTYAEALATWNDSSWWGKPHFTRLRQILTMAENCDVAEDGQVVVLLSAEDASEVFGNKGK